MSLLYIASLGRSLSSGDNDSSAYIETQHITISEFDVCCLLAIGFLLFGVFIATLHYDPTETIANVLGPGFAAIVLAMLFIGFQLNKIAKTKQ